MTRRKPSQIDRALVNDYTLDKPVELPPGFIDALAEQEFSEFENEDQTEQIDAVEFARIAGRTVYETYSRSNAPDSGWSFREDGTIDEHKYHLEITPQGDIFGSHKDVVAFLKDAELTGKRVEGIANLESHHLIPVEILNQSGIYKDDGIAVATDWQGHMKEIHGYGGLQQNLMFSDVTDLKNYYVSEYNEMGAPEWGERVGEYIEQHRGAFEKGLAAIAEQVETHDKELPEPPFSQKKVTDSVNKESDELSD